MSSTKTSIEWTDATWNPVTGCSKVSEGCRNCYAAALAPRLAAMGQEGYTKLPWNKRNASKNVTLHESRLEAPLSWTKPKKIFVNSMSDLFHELVPFDFVDRVFAVMAMSPRHTFQVLTKRPGRMAEYFSDLDGRAFRIEAALKEFQPKSSANGYAELVLPLTNVWLGTSVEDQRVMNRIDDLRDVPAAIRFLSCEPLIGPLPEMNLDGIHWVIVGGESGKDHRPIEAGWVREIRDQAETSGSAFFFKQWGGARPKTGGRTLDERTWDQMPHVFDTVSEVGEDLFLAR